MIFYRKGEMHDIIWLDWILRIIYFVYIHYYMYIYFFGFAASSRHSLKYAKLTKWDLGWQTVLLCLHYVEVTGSGNPVQKTVRLVHCNVWFLFICFPLRKALTFSIFSSLFAQKVAFFTQKCFFTKQYFKNILVHNYLPILPFHSFSLQL